MLPSTRWKASATRILPLSVLNSPDRTHRYRRFTAPLAGDDARLAETYGWLALYVTELASAVSCQFAWRTPSQGSASFRHNIFS